MISALALSIAVFGATGGFGAEICVLSGRGIPVEGAQISARAGVWRRLVTTGEDGCAALHAARHGEVSVSVAHEAHGEIGFRRRLPLPDRWTLSFVGTGLLDLTVRTSDEGPLPRGFITLHGPDRRLRHVELGAQGRLQSESMAPGSWVVRASPRRSRYAPASVSVDIPADGNRRVELVLQPGLTISGSVVDGWGRPVAGVRVSARRGDGFPASAVSRSNGVFVVRGLAPGLYWLRDGLSSIGAPVIEVAAGSEGVVVEASVQTILRVRVEGPPAATVRVVSLEAGGYCDPDVQRCGVTSPCRFELTTVGQHRVTRPNSSAGLGRIRALEDGWYETPELQAGAYRIRITDGHSSSSHQLSTSVTFRPGPPPVIALSDGQTRLRVTTPAADALGGLVTTVEVVPPGVDGSTTRLSCWSGREPCEFRRLDPGEYSVSLVAHHAVFGATTLADLQVVVPPKGVKEIHLAPASKAFDRKAE